MKREHFCIVIGAGISGLMGARVLSERNRDILVLDKGRGVGGRMATRRHNTWRFDHGAQGIRCRSTEFCELMDQLRHQDFARLWYTGNPAGSSEVADECELFCGVGGISSITKALAKKLKVVTSCKVTAIRHDDSKWHISTENGTEYYSRVLILTAPAPQSLALLDAGEVQLDSVVKSQLARIEYERCLAVMVGLDKPSRIPNPGAIRLDNEAVSWIADNHQKGVSPEPGAITVLSTPEYAFTNWAAAHEDIAGDMIRACGEFLGGGIIHTAVHRWRYSQAMIKHLEPCLIADVPGLIGFAGDGFAGDQIEGAALSGKVLAKEILGRL